MNWNNSTTSPLLDSLRSSLSDIGISFPELSPEIQQRLQTLVRYSPRLATVAAVKPEFLAPSLAEGALESPRTRREFDNLLQTLKEKSESPETAVRIFHRQEMIRIAWRDLCDLADIQQITEELSDLADTVIDAVFKICWEQKVAEFGIPTAEDSQEPVHMAVIGVGKLGGRELNFSSDIDLMFVFGNNGETVGGTNRPISNQLFFTQLAQEICDCLSRVTPDGFLYRVDTRLRPEGSTGALAFPLLKVEIYYHTYGENWERQALLKARPVAGHSEVGKQFIKLITPFTYRKYVDETEISEVLRAVDRMRNKSLEMLGNSEQRKLNFKNGYGGIRDIEFFVQAVQMLYGGQYPEIKLRGTLLSLQRMHESHLLHSREYEFLSTAYRFLRKIEHRLQMAAEQQVYELPKDPAEQAQLAASMGFSAYSEFKRQYEEVTGRVRDIYAGVFKREEWKDPSEILSESETFTEPIRELLAAYDIEDPRQAFTFIRSLQTSPDIHLQPKITRLFKLILPRLFSCLKKSPDPDMALANFDQLVSSFKARSALYETLSEQPSLLELLVSVISCSSFLTRLVLRDPSLMDTIGHEHYLERPYDRIALEDQLQVIAQAYPAENRRDHLLRVQNAAMFHSGIRFILGLCDVEAMGRELTDIAEFVIVNSFSPVNHERAERYPNFTQQFAGDLGIIGYGKLGGSEFNVASDCDLVFVYVELCSTDEIDAAEYFQRWASKFVEYQESKSRLGFLYHCDPRLRPHGRNAPMASSWSAFAEYYRSLAQFWEKMALTRARFICGNLQIKESLELLKNEVLFSAPPRREEIESLLAMRKRIETEKQEETLKAGPGGMIDIEFISQALVLSYGYVHPEMRSPSTLATLRAAKQLGLMPTTDAQSLIDSYLLQREVENRMRIVNNVSLDALPTEPKELEKLTRRYRLKLGAEVLTPESFLETIRRHSQSVREIYNRFFEQLKLGLCD